MNYPKRSLKELLIRESSALKIKVKLEQSPFPAHFYLRLTSQDYPEVSYAFFPTKNNEFVLDLKETNVVKHLSGMYHLSVIFAEPGYSHASIWSLASAKLAFRKSLSIEEVRPCNSNPTQEPIIPKEAVRKNKDSPTVSF